MQLWIFSPIFLQCSHFLLFVQSKSQRWAGEGDSESGARLTFLLQTRHGGCSSGRRRSQRDCSLFLLSLSLLLLSLSLLLLSLSLLLLSLSLLLLSFSLLLLPLSLFFEWTEETLPATPSSGSFSSCIVVDYVNISDSDNLFTTFVAYSRSSADVTDDVSLGKGERYHCCCCYCCCCCCCHCCCCC